MNLHDKIEQLRKQPEHVRLRTATMLTAVSGVVLVALWLVVLLPLQLKFTNPSKNSDATPLPQQANNQQNILAVPATTLPQQGIVAGAQSSEDTLPVNSEVEVSPLPSIEVFPSVLPSIDPSITPTVSPTVSPIVKEDDSLIVAPSPLTSSVPVQITH